jgi:phenylacetic acid degradation operon negative regulatory protein
VTETTGAGSTSVPTRLLVFGMVHPDGVVHAEELFGVADACGVTGDQLRSCLRRMVAEGSFTREGSGRTARYLPTEAGTRAQATFLERIRLAYAQDLAGRGWDRHWHLVAFGIPEAKRAARDGLRDRLLALRGAVVHNGLYVSPHPWEDEVGALVDELGVRGSVTLAATDELEVGGLRDPRELAARLWPVAELAARYQAFVDEHEKVPAYLESLRSRREHLSDDAFMAGTLTATVDFQSIFNDDPLLPPELLPRPWPGRAARDLLLRTRRQALQLRTTSTRPALFRVYDELIESLR